MIINKNKLYNILVVLVIITILLEQPCYSSPVPNSNDAEAEAYLTNDDEYNVSHDEKTKENLRECERNPETMELCMRCAKITRSTFVYPLCCGNEDAVKDWCHDYIYYRAPENISQGGGGY